MRGCRESEVATYMRPNAKYVQNVQSVRIKGNAEAGSKVGELHRYMQSPAFVPKSCRSEWRDAFRVYILPYRPRRKKAAHATSSYSRRRQPFVCLVSLEATKLPLQPQNVSFSFLRFSAYSMVCVFSLSLSLSLSLYTRHTMCCGVWFPKLDMFNEVTEVHGHRMPIWLTLKRIGKRASPHPWCFTHSQRGCLLRQTGTLYIWHILWRHNESVGPRTMGSDLVM